jgi:hypothetical protein
MTSQQRTYIISVVEELERRITSTRRRARKIRSLDAAVRLVRRRLPDCTGHPTFISFVAACDSTKRDCGWRAPLTPSLFQQTQFAFALPAKHLTNQWS